MTPAALQQALTIARNAAEEAGRLALAYARGGVQVEIKADESPVTRADREAEQLIRHHLRTAFPDHAVYGEEFGRSGDHRCLWLVDPIDGTRSFIRGLPFWSVQIALMVEGELALGVSHAPAAGETAWALRGQGAWLDGQALKVAPCTGLNRADLSLGNLKRLAGGPGWMRLANIVRGAARCRGYGDYYPYHRLAAGQLDAVIESDVNILDIAALHVIVTEADGRFTDLDGGPVGLATTSVLAASPNLHERLLSLLHAD